MHALFYCEIEIEAWGRLSSYRAAGHSVIGFQADLLTARLQVVKNQFGGKSPESASQVVGREHGNLGRTIIFWKCGFEFIFLCDRDWIDRGGRNTCVFRLFVRFLVRDVKRV